MDVLIENKEKPKPLLFSIEAAADLISISPHTIRKYEREGRIKSTRIGTRVLIPVDEINRIAKEGIDPFPTDNNN